MSAPRLVMRSASHRGTCPPCSGRSALPVLCVIGVVSVAQSLFDSAPEAQDQHSNHNPDNGANGVLEHHDGDMLALVGHIDAIPPTDHAQNIEGDHGDRQDHAPPPWLSKISDQAGKDHREDYHAEQFSVSLWRTAITDRSPQMA